MAADKKYRHDGNGIITSFDIGFQYLREFENVRARIEHVNGFMKNFGALSQSWRHDRFQHRVVFHFIANVFNVSMELKEDDDYLELLMQIINEMVNN